MPLYVLDVRTATPHFPGIGRYVRNLARALVPLLRKDERLVLIEDSHYSLPLQEPSVVHVPLDASPFTLRQQWAVPRYLARLGAVCYHSPYYLMPFRPGVPTLLTVYDVIPLLFPQHTTPRARFLFRWMHSLALGAASRVVVVSETTRRDLTRHFTRVSCPVSVIPLAADPVFRPPTTEVVEAVKRRYALHSPYMLYLGSGKPHKNLPRLIEAWVEVHRHFSDHILVIAGLGNARTVMRGQPLDLSGSVRWLGSVTDEALAALYGGAHLFVFPSLYEGFGLPVLEAMACGAPVVCSAVGALQEVAGDAALYFNPEDAEDIADALVRALEDESLRERLSRAGLQRAASFSWARAAQTTLTLYRQLTAGG